jgi:hypothetical protein
MNTPGIDTPAVEREVTGRAKFWARKKHLAC